MAKYEVTIRYTTYEVVVVNTADADEARDIAMRVCPIVPDVENSAFSVEVADLEEIQP
jgi:hypothetical protein